MSDTAPRPESAPISPEGAERVRDIFRADRATYWRDHALMAAAAMAAGMAILALMGNPHVWTGAVGGLAAIALRAFYLSSEALTDEWRLTDSRLLGPGPTEIPLAEISAVRGFGSAVQVVTREGNKYLLKYLADRSRVEARIAAAAGVSHA